MDASRSLGSRAISLILALFIFVFVAMLAAGCTLDATPTVVPTVGPPTSSPVLAPLSPSPIAAVSPSGAAPAADPAAPARPKAEAITPTGTLRLAGSEPRSLDPALTQDIDTWGYLLQVFSGLVGLDDDLNVVPDLAESWDVSPDGRTYRFTLRSNARFHDGREVTSADVKFSIERALDPAMRSPSAATYLGDIVGAEDRLAGRAREVAGVRVPDARTVEIVIDEPKPYFLAKLTYPTAFVVDRANVGRGAEWYTRPNGTGPFRLERWDRDSLLVLAANRDYHRGTPRLARVEYRLEPGSAISWYETDEIDAVSVGPANVERVTDPRGRFGGELRRVPQLSVSYIGFAVSMPPFDDPKVRLAFAAATDRARLAKVTFKGMREPAAGILPPGIDGHDPDFAAVPFDPAAARRHLAESSYGSAGALPPITLTMGRGSGEFGESLAEMYARNLGVTIDVLEVQDGYFDGLNARAYQMFYLGWVADYPDPQDFLDILLHGDSEANHGGFADPAVDSLLERARTETDVARRLALYRQAEEAAMDAAPVIPLFFDTDYVLVKPWVRDLRWTALGPLSLRDVTVSGR